MYIFLFCFIFTIEAPYFSRKHPDDQSSHIRRSSEKVKKRMKMADLRAFVETKLLSKSDKALEKIGHDETKSLDDHVQRQVHNWVVIKYN